MSTTHTEVRYVVYQYREEFGELVYIEEWFETFETLDDACAEPRESKLVRIIKETLVGTLHDNGQFEVSEEVLTAAWTSSEYMEAKHRLSAL